MAKRLRTADYSQEARNRLAEAVVAARTALGPQFKFRPAFAKHVGISVRSLAAIESGDAGIGEANLKAVARALPGWIEDVTPRAILDGEPAPPTTALPVPADEAPEASAELTFTATEKDRARWRTMTPEEITDEGEMIGRTISEAMRIQYLRAALAARTGTLEPSQAASKDR